MCWEAKALAPSGQRTETISVGWFPFGLFSTGKQLVSVGVEFESVCAKVATHQDSALPRWPKRLKRVDKWTRCCWERSMGQVKATGSLGPMATNASKTKTLSSGLFLNRGIQCLVCPWVARGRRKVGTVAAKA